MASGQKIDGHDVQLLSLIKRGPGHYPTPPPDRVQRLVDNGLIKKVRGRLRLTLKGRLRVWFRR